MIWGVVHYVDRYVQLIVHDVKLYVLRKDDDEFMISQAAPNSGERS